MTQIVLTSGTSWTVPSDWTSTGSVVVCIGGGQNGTTAGTGGDGGGFASISDLALTAGATIAYAIGAAGTTGGDTWFDSVSTVLAPGGGSTTAAVGTTVYAGGAGATGISTGSGESAAGGGGGAAGPNGAGVAGTKADVSVPQVGVGGAGDAGHGGAGGGTATSDFDGSAGTEYTTAGAGGGGTGGIYNAEAYPGGTGGAAGGGGGGGVSSPAVAAGSGAAGVIVITYTSTPPVPPLPPIVAPRVQQFTATTGTGDLVLGATPPNCNSFASALTVGKYVGYLVIVPNSNIWEQGVGTLVSATDLARTYVEAGSSGTSPVDLPGPLALVICAPPPAQIGVAWSATTFFAPGDIATYDGLAWTAVLPSINSTPASANANWIEMGGGAGAAGVSSFNTRTGAVVPVATDYTPAFIGAEPALGDPSTSGYVLSSTTAGVRSWVAQSGGEGGSYTFDAPLSLSGTTVSLDTVPVANGGTGATVASTALANLGGEPALGDPAASGYVLSSTVAGVRSWVAQSGGSAGNYTPPWTGSVVRSVNARLADILSVKDFGATGNGMTNDTAAIQAAISASSSSGIAVYFPAGTYKVSTIVLPSNVALVGENSSTTVLSQIAGTNADLLQGSDAESLFGSGSNGGIVNARVEHFTLDGSSSYSGVTGGNTSGNCIAIYGWNFILNDLNVTNAAGYGIRTEAGGGSGGGTGDDSPSAIFSDLVVFGSGLHGVYFGGPHDTEMTQVIVAGAGAAGPTATYDAFQSYNETGCRMVGCHCYNTGMNNSDLRYALNDTTGGMQLVGGDFEGGQVADAIFQAGSATAPSQVIGSRFYATASGVPAVIVGSGSGIIFHGNILPPYTGTSCYGVQIGTSSQSVSYSLIEVTSTSNALGAVYFMNSGGHNHVVARGYAANGPSYAGTPASTDVCDIQLSTGTNSLVQGFGTGGGSAGVTSFNARTGAVSLESSDVTTALGYSPANLATDETVTGIWTMKNSVYIEPPTNTNGIVLNPDNYTLQFQQLGTGDVTFGINTSNGNAYTTETFTCTALTQTSDAETKENVHDDAPRPLHRKLPFKSWQRSGRCGHGAVAQDVQAAAPEYVYREQARPLSIALPSMAWEQAVWASTEVDKLRSELAVLRAMVTTGGSQ